MTYSRRRLAELDACSFPVHFPPLIVPKMYAMQLFVALVYLIHYPEHGLYTTLAVRSIRELHWSCVVHTHTCLPFKVLYVL